MGIYLLYRRLIILLHKIQKLSDILEECHQQAGKEEGWFSQDQILSRNIKNFFR